MPRHDNSLDKVALVAELVRRAPTRPGRTAVMKLAYFLKVLRDVPLSYKFSLYTYGPYDSDVLDDLRYAQALGAVESETVTYPGGRGYEYRPGPRIDEITDYASDFVSRHSESIDWVLAEFGSRSASDLEMASTLIYADRDTAEKRKRIAISELARMVNAIKPYLSRDAIEKEARSLEARGLLTAVA